MYEQGKRKSKSRNSLFSQAVVCHVTWTLAKYVCVTLFLSLTHRIVVVFFTSLSDFFLLLCNRNASASSGDGDLTVLKFWTSVPDKRTTI